MKSTLGTFRGVSANIINPPFNLTLANTRSQKGLFGGSANPQYKRNEYTVRTYPFLFKTLCFLTALALLRHFNYVLPSSLIIIFPSLE